MKSKREVETEENEAAADLADNVIVFTQQYLEGYSDALRWVLGHEKSYSEERDEILK